MTTLELLQHAKRAKSAMALASPDVKNSALAAMAGALEEHTQAILAANALDLEAAKGAVSDVMLDRLALNPERIKGMAGGVREVAALPDPVGLVLRREVRPNGLVIEKTAVPMGAADDKTSGGVDEIFRPLIQKLRRKHIFNEFDAI